MAANIAPGMNREFTAEQWENLIPKKEWYMAIEEANDNICMDIETDIQGFDLDENVITGNVYTTFNTNYIRRWDSSLQN